MDTKALRQKMLDLAIRGKLVPQDPNDEPASVLLERIRQQKQQMVKDGKLKAKDIKNDTIIFVSEDNLHYEKFADGSVKCIEDEIPFELPDGWAWSRLGAVAEAIGDGDHQPPPQTSFGVPFLVISNVSGGRLSFENTRFVSKEYFSQLPETRKPRNGDLLFTVTGSYGIPVLIDSDDKFCFQRHIAIVRPCTISNRYLYVILGSSYVKSICDAKATGTAQKTVGLATLRELLIPVAPYKEQMQIYAQTQDALSIVDSVSSDKEDLLNIIESAKAKILDLAIRGQLVPQDPTDEPASVLLERIRAEKEELIWQGKIKRDKKESVIFRGEDNSYYQKVEADGSVVIQRVDVPPTWAVCCLQEISYPVSTVGMQIKSEEIQKDGVFPVISQGQSFIDGYYSDESKVIYDSPIILFGDHTRNVKCIDFPFVVGADGTKLHKVIRANERYVYYWMCHASQCIADRGYARHYSLLQKECFTLPPIAEQIRIVNCIDQLFAQLDSIADALL